MPVYSQAPIWDTENKIRQLVIVPGGSFVIKGMEEEALVGYLESAKFTTAAANSSRLIAKLKSAVQRRELYETHQIIRTIYFRFINAKEKVAALEELLYEGSCYLLKLNEHVSGQDIAALFLETASKSLQYRRDEGGEEARQDLANSSLAYHQQQQTMDWDISRKVSHIGVNLPDTEIGQSKFIAEALRILSPKLLNKSLLHNVMAVEFWQHKNFINSRYHYLHCASLENAHDIANLLVEYQTSSASKSEVDLFITQFIFQFLCLQCPLDPPEQPASHKVTTSATPPNSTVSRKTRGAIRSIAEKIFSTYALRHPLLTQVCVPFSSLPLLNFTYFTISILDASQEAATFRMLRDIYRATWIRDPNYDGYLNRIGALYFGLVDQAKQRQGGGFLNNILMSLLDGTDDDEEERNSNQEANNFSSCDELD